VAEEKRKRGRPPKLKPDAPTLNIVRGAGQIQCTNQEAATLLKVSRETFEQFLGKYKEANEAWKSGQDEGKVSLRRTQLRMAQTSYAMAIFLGKNILGQRDNFAVEHGGTVQHNISVELQHVLQDYDGQTRSLPGHAINARAIDLLPGSRVEAGSHLQDSERVGGNGHIPKK
jgi:hypothetical protein